MFFAYLRRTIAIEAPERASLRPLGWWLALLAATGQLGLVFQWLAALSGQFGPANATRWGFRAT
jgi:hypothetical protein